MRKRNTESFNQGIYYFRLTKQVKIMSWYHSAFLTIDRRPSNLIASCRRFSRRLSTGIFRAVRRIKTSGRDFYMNL